MPLKTTRWLTGPVVMKMIDAASEAVSLLKIRRLDGTVVEVIAGLLTAERIGRASESRSRDHDSERSERSSELAECSVQS